MPQATDTPSWIAWIAPITAAGGVIFAFVRRVFVSVTREELQSILEKGEEQREAKRQEQHRENLDNFRNLFERLGEVEQSQARLEGQLSGRFPRIDR